MSEKYKEHPIAAIFPMIGDGAFEKLKSDIALNGIKESGLLFQGKILDGRNRYKAACQLGIEMSWQEVENSEPEEIATFDPLAYVLSQNLHRRHLKQSQRAMIAAKMATLKRGDAGNGRKVDQQNCLPIDDAANLLSVGSRSVIAAKYVIDNGCKQLIDAVEACEVTVSMAEKLCKACDDKREQAKLVKEGRKAIAEFIKPMPDDSGSEEIEPIDGIGDKYDEPVVRAFKVADYKLNTLRQIIAGLPEGERQVVRDWLNEV
jgi:hypothetical protein